MISFADMACWLVKHAWQHAAGFLLFFETRKLINKIQHFFKVKSIGNILLGM